MVLTRNSLLLAKATVGTSTGAVQKASYTPTSLYRFLLRQCKRLPNEEVGKYYKHHIRQSFNQHADETDPERVAQIINQAAKDIEWVLKKWATMEEELRRTHHESESDTFSSEPFVIEAPVSSLFKFYNALSTFTSRPELLVPQIRSTDIAYDSIEPQRSKRLNNVNVSSVFDYLYSSIYNEGKCAHTVHPAEFTGSLQDVTVTLLTDPSNKFKRLEFYRLIHHKPLKDNKLGWTSRVHEAWDFQNHIVDVVPDSFPNQISPYTGIRGEYFAKTKTVRLTITPYLRASEADASNFFDHYKKFVVTKILEWMSDEYTSEPPTLSRLRARPLSYVHNSKYWLFSDILKAGPAQYIKEVWQECTDPVKFIHEDVGIAAYIAAFIMGESNLYRPNNNARQIDVVDFGCGNGLLCYFLSQALPLFAQSAKIVGFDIRRRKLWSSLQQQEHRVNETMLDLLQSRQTDSSAPIPHSNPEISLKLIERTFEPHSMDDLMSDYGCSDGRERALWLIGNHSDELTPWIPFVARRLKASGFFIIPCCPFDFFNKYQRRGEFPGSSVYQNYLEYICHVGDMFGYQPTCDKLRIPSTKNICLVGIESSRKFSEGVISGHVDQYMQQLTSDVSEKSPSKFIPRSKESANESPKLNLESSNQIVHKIFLTLLKEMEHSREHTGWYAGREDLTFAEINNELTIEERGMMKGKGNGLRTLVKSNRHLFVINGNFVKLRIPTANDINNVSECGRSKIKTRNCYFQFNHPQGCPLPDEQCSYKH